MERITVEKMPEVKNENLIHLQRYVKFINSRPERDLKKDGLYFNIHHIVPRALKGANDKSNLIKLTHREHYIAHLILWKCGYREMISAFWYLTHINNLCFVNSKQFSLLKQDYSKRVSFLMKGKPKSSDHKYKLSLSKLGDKNPNYGVPMSDKNKKLLSERTSGEKSFFWQNPVCKDTIWYTNEKESIRLKSSDTIPNGFNKGQGFTSYSTLGKNPYNNGEITKFFGKYAIIPPNFVKGHLNLNLSGQSDKIYINNGIKTTTIPKDSQIPEGWIRGMVSRKNRVNEANRRAATGKIFINNGSICTKIDKNSQIPDGWVKGGLKRKPRKQ